MDDERGLDDEQPRGAEERPGAAQPWHRRPVEPEGPPPWTSSEPGEGVWGAGAGRAEPARPASPGQPSPADSARVIADAARARSDANFATGAVPAPTGHGGAATPPGYGGAGTPPGYGGAGTPPGYGGASTPPGYGGASTPPGFAGAAPPGGGRFGVPGGEGPVPPARRGADSFARGIVLYLAASSILSGIAAVLTGGHVSTAGSAAILGIGFVVLFVVALALRPGPALDPVRATLAVVSVLLLVGCFIVAVGAGDTGTVTGHTELVRAAAAAGLFTLGMGAVAVLVPSAVAAGLAVLGVVATVVLASAAAGAEGFGLAVAAVIGGVAALELSFRAAVLRLHPGAASWMVNVAALLTGLAATLLGSSFQGSAAAAAGLAGVALAVCAWRWHAVVAAVAAVAPLSLVEGYVVVSATGSDSTAEGVVVLLVGLVLLVAVGLAGLRLRSATPRQRRRRVVPEELLLVAAAVMALVALSQVGNGFGSLHFNAGPFTQPATPTFEPLPTFRVFPTLRPFPTFPTLPPG